MNPSELITIVIVVLILVVGGFALLGILRRHQRFAEDLRTGVGAHADLLAEGGVATTGVPAHTTWLQQHAVLRSTGEPVALADGRLALVEIPEVLSDPWLMRERSRSGMPTLLGIFGTFVGIAYLLFSADLQVDTTEAMLSTAQTVLAGMKIAFLTSAAGLFVTVVLRFFEWAALQRGTDIVAAAERSLLERAAVVSPEWAAAQSRPDVGMGQAAERLSSAVGELTKSMAALQSAQDSMSPEALGQALGQVIDARLTPVFTDIRDSLAQLEEIKRQSGAEVLKEALDELKVKLLEPTLEEVKRSAKISGEAGVAVRELTTSVDALTKQSAEAVSEIRTFQTETVTQLLEFAESLRTHLESFRTETEKQLEVFRDEYTARLDDFFQGQNTLLEEVLGKQREELAGVVLDLRKVFDDELETRKEVGVELDKQVAQLRALSEQTLKLATELGLSDTTRLAVVQDATREVVASMAKVNKQNQRLQEAWSESNERLSGYLTQAHEHYAGSLKEMDDASYKIASQLLQAAQVLASAASVTPRDDR